MDEVQRPPRRGVQILGLGFLSVAMFGAVQAAIWLGSDEPGRAWGPIGEGAFFTGLGLLCFVRQRKLQDAIVAICGTVTLLAIGVDAFRTGDRGVAIGALLLWIAGVTAFGIVRKRRTRAAPIERSLTPAERFVIVRALWNEFDPRGVFTGDDRGPVDAYDSAVEESIARLVEGVTLDELAASVRAVCEDRMGLPPRPERAYAEFAERLLGEAAKGVTPLSR